MTRREVVSRTIKAIDNAASAIEAKDVEIARLSKALSEAEAALRYYEISAGHWRRLAMSKPGVSEIFKASAPFAQLADVCDHFDHKDDRRICRVTIDGVPYDGPTAGDCRAIRSARAFLNAGKE